MRLSEYAPEIGPSDRKGRVLSARSEQGVKMRRKAAVLLFSVALFIFVIGSINYEAEAFSPWDCYEGGKRVCVDVLEAAPLQGGGGNGCAGTGMCMIEWCAHDCGGS